MKLTDKAILRMVSESPGRNTSELPSQRLPSWRLPSRRLLSQRLPSRRLPTRPKVGDKGGDDRRHGDPARSRAFHVGASQRDETAGGKRGGADRHQNQTSHRAFQYQSSRSGQVVRRPVFAALHTSARNGRRSPVALRVVSKNTNELKTGAPGPRRV